MGEVGGEVVTVGEEVDGEVGVGRMEVVVTGRGGGGCGVTVDS